MKFSDLVLKSRSYRRFHQQHDVSLETLKELTKLARISASGANRQALKFNLVSGEEDCSRIFPHTIWAGYLKDWEGPEQGEQPSAYIIILGDTDVSSSFGVDHGIAAQNILLGATEIGLGGCMIGSIRRDGLRKELAIPPRYEILLILAMGKPKEIVQLDNVQDNDIRYWRDDEGIHHVPKRSIDDLIIEF